MAASDIESVHRAEVSRSIRAAVERGAPDFATVLRSCEGADPDVVYEIYEREFPGRPLPHSAAMQPRLDPTDPRLSLVLPAPDPSRSQWWFTSSAIEYLAELTETQVALFDNPRILCLGTPSLGHYLAHRGHAVDILDIDPDVVSGLAPLPEKCSARSYDVADPIQDDLKGQGAIAVLDPPWYESAIRAFLARAIEALRLGGEAIMTLPPRLTRPGVEMARAQLLDDVLKAGHEILALEHRTVAYQVPRFELAALQRIRSFASIPWRSGDLLHIRKGTGSLTDASVPERSSVRAFSRNPRDFRIFASGSSSLPGNLTLSKLDKYSSSISTRAHAGEIPDIWSTEKVGVHVGQLDVVMAALTAWQDRGKNKSDVLQDLAKAYGEALSREIVDRLDSYFQLWSRFAEPAPLRSDDEIDAIKSKGLTHWASKPSDRERPDPSDTFRGWFQRDRDRVLWSSALRRLSNKTQLFPATYDDQLRQRLAHSIEVSQLATTISASFGLDRDLVEAGALAHDVGHTPFGHAGEHALNKLFNAIDKKLGGFNHYEHGVDVVRWLEGPYYVSDAVQSFGLNLTPEVLECILKHTFHYSDNEFSTQAVHRNSKHRDIIPQGHCHLEGQSVRIADKISYFLSDLEDGIRLGVLTDSDLQSCQFFHRPPLDLISTKSGSLYDRFTSQRRLVLKILMEDVLRATNRRLSMTSKDGIRSADEYIVNHSQDVASEVSEVWSKLQADKLHLDRRVISANLAAARIVSELTLAFTLVPELVERRFLEEHHRLWGSSYMKFYRDQAGRSIRIPKELYSFLPMHVLIGKSIDISADSDVAVENIVLAKDYVAGLSDSRARAFHRDLFGGMSGE